MSNASSINFHPDQRRERRLSRAARYPVYRDKPTVRKVLNHKCDLQVGENQIHKFINDGFFVLFRRRVRGWLTVSSSNLESLKFFKSTAQIEREKLRHFTKYFYMIHPFSKARFVWEMFMIPVFVSAFIIIPANAAASDKRAYLKLILDVICSADIVLSFFTGYFDENKHKVEMKFTRVAKQYLTHLFIFDLLSSIPFQFLYFTGNNRFLWLRYVSLTKVARLNTLRRYILKLCEKLDISILNHWMEFIIFIISLFFIIFWATCVLLIVMDFHMDFEFNKGEESHIIKSDEFLALLNTGLDALRGLLAIGVGEIQNISKVLMFCELLSMILGSIVNVILLAKIMQLLQYRSTSHNKYTSLLDEVHEYMKYKELPQRIREKIFDYMDFRFKRHIFREEEIVNTLSSMLKQEILLETCRTMVKKVLFFNDLPTHVMLRIVTQLRSEIFLPNDVIVTAGSDGNSMYFIYTGIVAVYTPMGQEICHLEDGNHFGEIALMMNAKRTATVIALRECEVFKLNRRDFEEAIGPFPELSDKIKEEAMKRLEATIKMTRKHEEDQVEKKLSLAKGEQEMFQDYLIQRSVQDDSSI